MGIKLRTNNRVLPNNARAADVAKSAVDRIIDVQNRKYQAAFQVQGYSGILYCALTHGTPCGCHSINNGLKAPRLDTSGNAKPEDINQMLTGNRDFKIQVYGVKPTKIDPNAPAGSLPSLWEVDEEADPLLDPFFGIDSKRGAAGKPLDYYSNDKNDPRAATILPDGMGPNGPVTQDISDLMSDFDASSFGITDVSCPMCFGTGFLGGFSVYNGWRHVLNYQHEGATFNGNTVSTEETVPYVNTDYAKFPSVLIPNHCVGVDALRVFANRVPVGASVFVDDIQLRNHNELLKYADGRPHDIVLQFGNKVNFTHLELQLNQSDKPALFEFPKTTKGGQQNLLESMQNVNISLSPQIPRVFPKDILIDSTLNKVWQITSVNNWNDRKYRTLGWECDARTVQPAELYTLLPRRRPIQSMKTTPLVRDNGSGHRRT